MKKQVKVVDVSNLSSTLRKPPGGSSKSQFKSFMSTQADKVYSLPATTTNKSGRQKRTPSNDAVSFKRMARDVELLGASSFTGRSKKEYERKKIIEMGGQAPKNIKTPIKILNGIRGKEKKKLTREREETLANGMYNKKSDRLIHLNMEKKKINKGERGVNLNALAGKYQNGVLHVNPALFKKGKGKGKGKKK